MIKNIDVKFPNTLALSLKMEDEEFAYEMKKLALVKLYEMGKISSGLASKALNIKRLNFLDILEQYNVSYFDEESIGDDLEGLNLD